MCDVIISAAILLALVEWLGDDAIDFTSAAVLAFLGFLIVLATTYGLAGQLGSASYLVGNIGAGIAVSVLLFLKYGVAIGRSFLIGALYIVGSVGWKFGLAVLLRMAF